MAGPATEGRLLSERAPAKVNLTLKVVGRRADGYHMLDSLVVFAGTADRLVLSPGDAFSLAVRGPTAGNAGPDDDNLVRKATDRLAALVPGLRSGAFTLLKRLPVAAGLGGGSSDAAAALRLLARANGLSPDDPRLMEAARATGADVPVCLDPRPRVMRGIGDVLSGPVTLPRLDAVLVNPRVAVPTPAVFRELAFRSEAPDGPSAEDWSGLDRAACLARLAEVPNDLEAPALRLAPAIGEALALLRATPGCRLARMSGSGATVFGLYDDCRAAVAAARPIAAEKPGWWVKSTSLG